MRPFVAPSPVGSRFVTRLCGLVQVPPVTNSAASGYCVLTFMPSMVTFSLNVFNLYAPTMAHIHAPGGPGELSDQHVWNRCSRQC